MSERQIYDGDFNHQGSIDDDGRIYDYKHSYIGRIEDGTVYDNCNIPHGKITDSGMVVDNESQEVGQEYGTGFASRGTRTNMGYVRGDDLSDSPGRGYGAFHLLNRDANYNNEESDDAEGSVEPSDDFVDTPSEPSYKIPRYVSNDENSWAETGKGCLYDAAGCVEGLMGLVALIIFIICCAQVVKGCWTGEIRF